MQFFSTYAEGLANSIHDHDVQTKASIVAGLRQITHFKHHLEKLGQSERQSYHNQ